MKEYIAKIVLGALFCVFSFFLAQSIASSKPHCDIDSSAYLEKANLLYNTGSFFDEQKPQQPYYSLGYPMLIALSWLMGGQTTESILWLHLLLALLSCLLLMALAGRLWGRRARYIAGFLWSINLGYLVFTQFILTEIVLSFFLLAFFERMVAWFFEKKLTSLLLAAFCLGCSVVIKPAALFFVWPVAIFILCAAHASVLKKMTQALLFVLSFYLPVVGYMAHNRVVFGQWQTGTLASVNLYFWFFPNVLAHCNGTTADHERERLLVLTGGKHDFSIVAPYFKQYVQQHPFVLVYVWAVNMAKTMFGLFSSNLKVLVGSHFRGQPLSFFRKTGSLSERLWSYITYGTTRSWVKGVALAEALWSILRFGFVFVALCVLCLKRQWWMLLFCMTYILYFCGITGHDGCARFRMMFEFVLIMLAAGGIDTMIKICGSGWSKHEVLETF